MSRFSTESLARSTGAHPWRTVLIWFVILIVFAGAAQAVFPLKTTSDVRLLNNPESEQGWQALIDHGIREKRSGTETVIVRSTTTTVDDPGFQSVVQSTTDSLRSNPDVVAGAVNFLDLAATDPDAAAGLVSADRKTTIIPVTLTGDLNDAVENAPDFLKLLEAPIASAPAFEIMTVGDASLNEEVNTIAEEDIIRGETIGAAIAFVILILVFGALVAAFVPLILAILSIGIATGLTAIISHATGELSFFVTNIISMIGLAVGIDYSLFVVERYREERRRGAAKPDAIAIAGSTASRSVLFSGMTVILALLGMFLVPNNIYQSLSIGAIVVVLVAVAASLTLLPAIIALLGDKLDWPRKRTYDGDNAVREEALGHETIHKGFWGRLTKTVMTHPVISLVLSVGFLLICALPYFHLQPGLNGLSSLPPDLESTQAYAVLAQEFSAGLVSPVEIVVTGSQDDPSIQAGMTQIQASLASATTDDGGALFGAPTVTTSQDGQLALISVPLNVPVDQPAGDDAIRQLRGEILPPIAETMNDAKVMVTGITANNVDFFDMRDKYTPWVFAFVLGLSFLLLMVVFRSVVVAGKAILMNLLSVAAAYGLIVWVFQDGNLTGLFGFQQVETIEAWLPLFLFSILFGLSMDYHVFLLSRIREHYDLTHRNAESVAVGLQATAKIITGAALIMVAVFAGFASGRLVFLQQMGFGLGVAVLLDATIVRCMLVPSAMALLGDRNWYLPKWLNWLPDLRPEPVATRPDSTAPETGLAPAD